MHGANAAGSSMNPRKPESFETVEKERLRSDTWSLAPRALIMGDNLDDGNPRGLHGGSAAYSHVNSQ